MGGIEDAGIIDIRLVRILIDPFFNLERGLAANSADVQGERLP